MNVARIIFLALAFTLIPFAARYARADERAERTAISDALGKLSASATSLAQTAKSADDRGARRKFAPAAAELADDLSTLSRRILKDVPLKDAAKDVADVAGDADKLVNLADEAEDKDTRKSLRAQAVAIAQAIAGVRKSIDAAAANASKGGDSPARYTGRVFNNSDSCSWAENLKFVVSRDGAQVFTSQLVFPGKDFGLVLERGRYLVQFFDTSGKFLGQGNLDAVHEGWGFKSGCVNQ
jgi:hypothetical protein